MKFGNIIGFFALLFVVACGAASGPVSQKQNRAPEIRSEAGRLVEIRAAVDEALTIEREFIAPIKRELEMELRPSRVALMGQYEIATRECGERSRTELLPESERERCTRQASYLADTHHKQTKAYLDNRMRIRPHYLRWIKTAHKVFLLLDEEMSYLRKGGMSEGHRYAVQAEIKRSLAGYPELSEELTFENNVILFAALLDAVQQVMGEIGTKEWRSRLSMEDVWFTTEVWSKAAPDFIGQINQVFH